MLLRLLPVILIGLLLPTCGLWGWLRSFGVRRRELALVWIPAMLLIGAGTSLSVHESYSPANATITGFYLILFIATTLALWLTLILSSLVLPFCKKRLRGKVLSAIGGVVSICAFSLLFYGHFEGMKRLQVVHSSLEFSDLPQAFDGYRLVFFSDFHLGTFYQRDNVPQRVVDSILAQSPQVILFGGDLVNYHTDEARLYQSVLSQLSAPDGVYWVMGNHDYQIHRHWDQPADRQQSITCLQSLMDSLGWKLLANENQVIVRDSARLAIIGVENYGRPPFPQLGDVQKAQQGLSENEQSPIFKLLISHDPTYWREKVLPSTDIQLTLSGHTHACQFQVGNFSPAKWFYKEWTGLYKDGKQQLFISKGLGAALLPFRLGAQPEINVITLHKQF